MNHRIILGLIAISLVALTALATGCKSQPPTDEVARDAMIMAGFQQHETVRSTAVTTKDSESHQMIVKMRLLAAGMSPELDDYDSVSIVEMKIPESPEPVSVVVVFQGDEPRALMPENLETP